ncbi:MULTISPECIES: GspH/FimT family pseudopilin [unclassified Thioalkalivibrio]|uniref:GspH/FimT family pseudopilin n=1 Tax=unclassified Thioalkalivibrio TaxID=2621013 RepID=UPI000377BAA9|nr:MULTISPECIES: GspH/FimT family pseudopilin [unclassified Thioalkalivibrio]
MARRARGFTLIELLVVLAILAGVAGLMVVQFEGALSGMETRAAARDVASALRAARGRAIATQQETGVAVDVEHRRYRLVGFSGESTHTFSSTIAVELFTDRTSLLSETEGLIRFFPDGSSTGGHVTLTSDAGQYTIEVAWLTGRVHLRPGPPPDSG